MFSEPPATRLMRWITVLRIVNWRPRVRKIHQSAASNVADAVGKTAMGVLFSVCVCAAQKVRCIKDNVIMVLQAAT